MNNWKLFVIASILGMCPANAQAQSAPPRLYFSDLDSGPNIGNSDTSLGQAAGQDGAIVSVWGANLGSSQGGSKVFCNGAEAVKVYYWGNAVPPFSPARLYNSYTQMQVIIFEISHLAVSGAGNITVNVGGAASNGIPFTVRPGKVFFVKTTGVRFAVVN